MDAKPPIQEGKVQDKAPSAVAAASPTAADTEFQAQMTKALNQGTDALVSLIPKDELKKGSPSKQLQQDALQMLPGLIASGKIDRNNIDPKTAAKIQEARASVDALLAKQGLTADDLLSMLRDDDDSDS